MSALLAASAPAAAQAPPYLLFESDPVRPLALSPSGGRLAATNIPDNHVELFDVDPDTGLLSYWASVPVGMEPVAVAWRSESELWVVNHLSDSVSVVSLEGSPHVRRTLLVGDEPRDIVFAGPSFDRAFVTAAHRGQNTPWPDGAATQPGHGRADVWVFDAAAALAQPSPTPLAVLNLFGDKPRPLAVTPDGGTVYAGIFHSGNQTTALNEGLVCNTSAVNRNAGLVQGPCVIGGETMPGGQPLPHFNHQSIPNPEVGIIVKKNRDGQGSGAWQDELGRDWSPAVRFDLPDLDVFAIDATGPTPEVVGSWPHVGTILFDIAVHPTSGAVYVTNTEARNEVRFEGAGLLASVSKPPGEPASVRGRLHQSRVTVLKGEQVLARHLNKHIDYDAVPTPLSVKEASLATPTAMAFTPDGATLYVAAFGSAKIGVFDTAALESDTFAPDAADHIELGGGGPCGLALGGERLYVLTRFDNQVRVVDTVSRAEVQAAPLHNPEPESVRVGRPFLYDARATSSNGEASCASCHVFGDLDSLAWDLGDPDGSQVQNPNPFPVIGVGNPVFHPMKGPMTTQSLRGMAHAGPQHWRGDRPGDEVTAFTQFNAAFPELLGRDEGLLDAEEMAAFTAFALQLRYPPNPTRRLDNGLRPLEATGSEIYHGPITDTVATCNGCHVLDPAQGFFGTDGGSSFEGETQEFKVPHLRNLYQKVGMFGMPQVSGSGVVGGVANFVGPFTHQGQQIRGYGFLHDGSVDTLSRFLSASVFSVNQSQRQALEAFMLAFPSDLAPAVGQQITVGADYDPATLDRAILLVERAQQPFTSRVLGGAVTECDLVAHGRVQGEAQSWMLGAGGAFLPDFPGPALEPQALLAVATSGDSPITLTCAPPGSGPRMSIDRDEDGLLNRVETNTGVYVSALDTGTDPLLADSDGDGVSDGVEVGFGTDPNHPDSVPCLLPACEGCPVTADHNADRIVSVADVQCAILVALGQLAEPGGAGPPCLVGGVGAVDLNCDGWVNVADVQFTLTIALDQPLPLAVDTNQNGCADACEAFSGPVCGDGVCDEAAEDEVSCPEDCGPAGPCGDGFCDAPSESPASCPADCAGLYTPVDCGLTYCSPEVSACFANSPCSQALNCGVACGIVEPSCVLACAADLSEPAASLLQALLSCATAAGCLQ